MNYLLSEKTKRSLDGLITDHVIDLTSPTAGRKPSMPSKAGSSAYSGPFAIAKLTDTSIEVLGYSATDSQYWNNYIIAGLLRIEVADGASVAVTASGYTYIGITWNGTIYVATLAHAAALPAQDVTHIYVPLAYVVVTDSKIASITQIQYGIIHFPARAG